MYEVFTCLPIFINNAGILSMPTALLSLDNKTYVMI